MEMDVEAPASSSSGQNDGSQDVRNMLALAREFINQGNPSHALQARTTNYKLNSKRYYAGYGVLPSLLHQIRHKEKQIASSACLVVMAVKSYGGDDAVLGTLTRARELYRKRIQENAAADELASLFAECAISQAQPLAPEPRPFDTNISPLSPDAEGHSILAKSGRKQIMLDAFADGSSFICLQCGGLVSNLRKDEHLAYWCCSI